MTIDKEEPTKAEMLAGLVTRTASTKHVLATVQRSHRFPVHIFTKIENLARIGGVPVSLIINELLECGLEALDKALPKEVEEQIKMVHEDQMDRVLVTDVYDGKKTPKLTPVK